MPLYDATILLYSMKNIIKWDEGLCLFKSPIS